MLEGIRYNVFCVKVGYMYLAERILKRNDIPYLKSGSFIDDGITKTAIGYFTHDNGEFGAWLEVEVNNQIKMLESEKEA